MRLKVGHSQPQDLDSRCADMMLQENVCVAVDYNKHLHSSHLLKSVNMDKDLASEVLVWPPIQKKCMYKTENFSVSFW